MCAGLAGAMLIALLVVPQARATFSFHREWSNYGSWSSWGQCRTETQCGNSEGTQTRSRSRTCVLDSGNGENECAYLGQVDTQYQHRGCEVELLACEPDVTPTPKDPDPLTPAGVGAGAPVCTDGNTILLPAGFQIKRAGPDATYIWFQTQADQVNLYYKELGQDNWTHAVGNVQAKAGAFPDNYNEYTGHALNPNLGYVFGLQQVHGCGGGQLVTAVVIDGPTTQLFPFSYWEWSK